MYLRKYAPKNTIFYFFFILSMLLLLIMHFSLFVFLFLSFPHQKKKSNKKYKMVWNECYEYIPLEPLTPLSQTHSAQCCHIHTYNNVPKYININYVVCHIINIKFLTQKQQQQKQKQQQQQKKII